MCGSLRFTKWKRLQPVIIRTREQEARGWRSGREADRSIANRDVVFWYTFGHTHVPRAEDYPVMPTSYIGFLIKPSGFFDINPSNDVPPSKAKHEGDSTGCKHC